MAVTLKKDRIIDYWGQMIDNGAGNNIRIMQMTEEYLKQVNPPNVTWGKTDVTTGFMGKKRDFLLVQHAGLRDYRMFIGARDFGQSLDVGWFLTIEPGLFKGSISKRIANGDMNALSKNLDVFSQQDLNAYVSVTHHCFVKAVEEIMKELELDTSGMQRRSKGFLSVW